MSTANKLLNDFRDLLDDQERVKEPSDGLIYRRFTEAQLYFMETLKTTKLPILIVLFQGQDEYPMPDNAIEISRFHFSRDELNPVFEFPNLSTDVNRVIKITNPSDGAMIKTGDVITADVWWKPNDDRVIDDDNEPLVERTYHSLLVDWGLSYYRKFNESFKSKEEIIMEAKRKRNRMYGLNAVQFINANFIRF